MAQDHDPRRASPNEEFATTNQLGHEIKVKADEHGVVRPTSPEEVALLDLYSLPVARAAKTKGDEA